MYLTPTIKFCTVLLHLSSFFLTSAFRLDDCDRPLGMESGKILDGSISARTSSKPGDFKPELARLNKNPGAWCATRASGDKDHGYLKVDFRTPKVITAVATQGRYDHGLGKGYAEEYTIKYQRDGLPDFVSYRNVQGDDILIGNNDTNTVVRNDLDSRIIAKSIQLFPHSEKAETVCIRVEFYGCEYNDEIKSYSMPEGATIGGVPFRDQTYDGQKTDTFLYGGIGLLTDGRTGENEPISQALSVRRSENWIAWPTRQHPNGTKIIFNYNAPKKIRRVDIFYNNARCRNGRMFGEVHVYCSSDNKTIDQGEDYFQPEQEVKDAVQQLTVAIECNALVVQVLLIPASDHIIVSEIRLSPEQPPEEAKKPNSKDKDKKPIKPEKPDVDNPKPEMVRDDDQEENEIGSATIIVATLVPCVVIVLLIVAAYLVWRSKYRKTGSYNVADREEKRQDIPLEEKDQEKSEVKVDVNDDSKEANESNVE